MTRLSSNHKLSADDNTLENLLDLHDETMEMGGGFWVKIEARRVQPTPGRPHGIDYSLCLFKGDERVICFDNAHPITVGSGPAAKKTEVNDHVHTGERIKPYEYTNAGTLVEHFWTAVDEHLKKEGVP